ncbi:MAG: dicarboxylate/amino acid:cation symporter [Pseudomonadota bacterium]|nr:dicarboxylate/amino acid:cation symporter [Pseudomonadota bacterium]
MKKKSLTLHISIAIGLGCLAGLWLGPQAQVLGQFGKLFIEAIKTIAAPLIFFAIMDSILTSTIRWQHARYLVMVITINTFFAATIGLVISNVFKPGFYLKLDALNTQGADLGKFKGLEKIDIIKTFVDYVPTNFVDPFRQNIVISVVLMAVLFGFGLKAAQGRHPDLRQSFEVVEKLVAASLKIFEVILGWIIKLIPFAIFGVIAKTVGEHGFEPFRGLAVYLLAGLTGLVLHVILIYQIWIKFIARIPLAHFWNKAKEPVLHAIGCNSSLATLPLTLKSLDQLGVSKTSARLGACLSTNFNNDGILLYEAMAVLFVAQAYGIDLSMGQQVVAMLFAIISAIGITGVPEAGVVSLSLVLITVGLPLEILPILLTVDWVIARGRSVVNVLSDMVVSIVVDKMVNRES